MNHSANRLFLTLLTIWALLVTGQSALAQTKPAAVTLDEMQHSLLTQSAVVIDIREPFEHATGVAKGAILMPMSTLATRLNELPRSKDKPLYVVCNTQNRSSRIVEQLQAAGFTQARYVNGGMSQWASLGKPMVKP